MINLEELDDDEIVDPINQDTLPSKNQFQEPSPRAGQSLTNVNGVLYLFGGANHEEGFLNDFYKYDGSWTRIDSACPKARYEHAAVETQGNLYILYGASDIPLQDVYVYTPGETWKQLETRGRVPSPRVVKCVAWDKRIYLFGGGIDNKPVIDSFTYCLDVKSGLWVSLTDRSPTPRLGHSMDVTNGKIYLFGGLEKTVKNDLWVFDIRANKWSVHETNVPGRCGHASIIHDGKLIISGGMDPIGPTCFNDFWVLNLGTFGLI